MNQQVKFDVDALGFAVCALIERLDLVFCHTAPGWNVRKGFSYTVHPQRQDAPNERTITIVPNGWGEKSHIVCSFVKEYTGEWRPNTGSIHAWHLKQPFDFAFQEMTFGHTFDLRAVDRPSTIYMDGVKRLGLHMKELALRHEVRA